MRRYRVRQAKDIAFDLDLIEDYLVRAYHELGDDPQIATARAATRIGDAVAYLRTFERHPHRGTEHPGLRPGLRTVTSRRFVFYFEIDEPSGQVSILAVFFGGVDHRQQIVERLRH